jgi:hypothetical protein
MSTLFTIASGNLTDNIFARTITDADITSVSAVMGIGNTPVDISTFASDGSSIWGVSFNVKSRADNPTGYFSCKLYDSFNVEQGSCVVPISNFPAGDGSDNIDSPVSQSWQTLKFDAPITTIAGNYYIRLSANTEGELFFYGLPQLDETIVDFASNSDIVTTGNATQGSFNPYNTNAWSVFMNDGANISVASEEAFFLGTQNFTIDFWCYLVEARTHRLVSLNNLNIDVSDTNALVLSGVSTGLTVAQNTWTHIAVTRTGNVLNGYVDGVISSNITIASNLNFAQASLVLGKDRTAATPYMHGHLFNFRVVKNQTLYTSNFAKPTSVATKISNGGATPSTDPVEGNVGFLILDGKNYLEGINRKLVNGTLTNSVKNSPYNIYSTALELMSRPIGCSYIEIPIAMTTRPTWTVDGFWYPNSTGTNNNAYFCDTRISNDASLVIYCPLNSLLYVKLGSTTKNTPIDPNGWNHVAVVYTNGVGDLYLNGTKTLSITSATPILHDYIRLLNDNVNSINTPAGSISHFRVSDNARYTQDFTPPSRSVPPKKDANTIFLLGRKNSHIMADKMGKWEVQAPYRAVRLLGNAKGGVAEFGMFTDGTPGGILYVPQLTWDMNSDWTVMIEFSVHPDSFPAGTNGRTIFRLQDASPNANTSFTMSLKMESSGLVYYYSYNGSSTPYSSLSAGDAPQNPNYGTFAAVYTSSTLTLDLYLNGSKVNSKVLTGPLFSPTTGGLSLFGGLNQTNYCKGYCSNFIVLNRKTTPVFSTNDYYYKDAVIWLDFNARTNSDFTNITMQTIGDISDSNIEVVGDFFNNSATSGEYKYSNVTPIIADSLPTYQSLAITPNHGNYPNVKLDYIDRPKSENYYISSSTDFTLESWVQTNTATNQGILNVFDGGLSFGLSKGKPFLGKSSSIILSSISAINLNDNLWHHLAVTRSSGNLSLFVDGRLSASKTDSTEFSAGQLRIAGDFNDPVNLFDGYLADVRLVKGQALYTTGFTPPTAFLSLTTNGGATPSVAPLSSNVLVLEANNPTADPTNILTYPSLNSGAIITQAPSATFSPFTPEEIYTPSTHGGSLYFDGIGDLVSVSERVDEFTFGTGDFTTEFWYFPTGTIDAGDAPLLTWESTSNLADGIIIKFTSSTNLQVLLGNNYTQEVTLDAPGTYLNQWSHIALTRRGNTYRLFVNGNLMNTAFYTGLNLSNDNDKLKIGEACKGYISDIRVTKGQALYIEYFTPPSSSLTLTQNGATGAGVVTLTATPNLLIKGTKAGIYDGSANNNILQEGTIFSVSLAETINIDANYRDNALVFNGVFNNNYLVIPPSPALDLAGDFWIDFWMNSAKWKRDSISRRILTLGSVSSVSAFHICLNATGTDKKLQIFSNTNILSSNLEYADGHWHHVGIGRSGSTLSLYRDGVLDASVTNNVDYKSGVVNNSYIGIYDGGTTGRYEGKLVGLRIINGECVHTSNYAVPTSPATLTSDGGTGINNMGNVSLHMKLNNIISPVNSHVITTRAQSLTGIIGNPKTSVLTTYNKIVSSADTPSVEQGAPAGTMSISFSSIGSWINVPTSNFQMKGDWTIEGYFKPLTGTNDGGVERMIMSFNSNAFYLGYLSGAYCLKHPSFTTRLSAAGAVSTWCHVAACKKANEISLYVNGTRTSASTATVDSQTVGDVFTAAAVMTVGVYHTNGAIGRYHGYMYRPRIIDGRALYDGNFDSNIVAKASALSATADTVFLYVDPTDIVYYRPGYLEKIVIGGSISNNNIIDPINITTSISSYCVLNNISIQNYGTFAPTVTSNNTFNITNNGLKIGSGGRFILSASPGSRKVINMDESRIHVLAGGTLDVRGQQKTIKATLTGYYTAGLSSFALNETPSNWLSGDSLIFLPPSADRTQFEELVIGRVSTNKLSSTTNSLYAHQYMDGIPSVANASRNIAIKGLSTNRRGWLQFDKTSNTYICDTEFEHLGRDGKKTESLILNVKNGGSFLLSGCYLDGSTGTSVNATTLYGTCYNITMNENVFYKYSGDTLAINNPVNNSTVINNLILRSTLNGIKLQNASFGGNLNFYNNISLANGQRGTYLENVDGNVEGSVNWYNTTGGLYIAAPTTGENKDLTDENIIVRETATTNTVVFDNPFGDNYPEETSSIYSNSIIWDANPKYVFSEDFTLEGFFKFTTNGTAAKTIFDTNAYMVGTQRWSGPGMIGLSYQSNTQTFRFYTNETGVGVYGATLRMTIPVSYMPLNTWHHIAICRKDDVISFYLNGNRLAIYTSNFEFKADQYEGILLSWNNTDTYYLYGFRILNRAEYDSVDTITVPTAPFVVDDDTLLLYKRTVKTGTSKINNILNRNNAVGGLYIDNTLRNLKNTTISNISCIGNTGYGISVDGTNLDYREANSLTATNIVVQGNTTIGLNLNNMTGVLTGVLATNNTTTNIQLKLGDGVTKVKSVTGLMGSNNANMIVYSSKSFRPVIFDDIYLDKSTSLVGTYSVAPLHIRGTEFLNFHFDNSTLATANTSFAVTLSGTVLGTYQFSNTVTTSAGVQNLSCLPSENIKSGGIIFMNKNRNIGSHESFYRKGKRATDTSLVAGNVGEKLTPLSLTEKFKSGSKFVAISTNDTVDLKMKVAVTNAYNGSNPRLIIKKNASIGFNEDRVIYTFPKSTAYSESTMTTPSASGVGIMEFYVDCDGTAGSVIIDEWKAK